MSAEPRMFIASVNGDGVAGAACPSPIAAITSVVELIDGEWRSGEPTFTVTLHEVERLLPSAIVDDKWFGDDEDGEPASAYLLLDALDGANSADFWPSGVGDLTQVDTDALADLLDVPAAERAAAFDAWAASHPSLDYGWWSIISVDDQTRWVDLEINPEAASWDDLLPAWAKFVDGHGVEAFRAELAALLAPVSEAALTTKPIVMVDQLIVYPNARGFFAEGSAHLTVDGTTPEHMDALHAFAKSIGLRRAWFQPHKLAAHYDLTPGRHAAALAKGAVLVDAFEQARLRIEARKLAASTQGK